MEDYELLSGIIENSNEGMILVNNMQVVSMCNTIARNIFEISKEEAIGWKLADTLRENESILEAYNIAFNKKQKKIIKTTIKNKSGISLNVECKFTILRTFQGESGDILLILNKC